MVSLSSNSHGHTNEFLLRRPFEAPQLNTPLSLAATAATLVAATAFAAVVSYHCKPDSVKPSSTRADRQLNLTRICTHVHHAGWTGVSTLGAGGSGADLSAS